MSDADSDPIRAELARLAAVVADLQRVRQDHGGMLSGIAEELRLWRDPWYRHVIYHCCGNPIQISAENARAVVPCPWCAK